jgi:hypothetical protein
LIPQPNEARFGMEIKRTEEVRIWKKKISIICILKL